MICALFALVVMGWERLQPRIGGRLDSAEVVASSVSLRAPTAPVWK
jgi:hypothetical protein